MAVILAIEIRFCVAMINNKPLTAAVLKKTYLPCLALINNVLTVDDFMSSGAATYRILITVPPGKLGMAPKSVSTIIAIIYRIRGPFGIL